MINLPLAPLLRGRVSGAHSVVTLDSDRPNRIYSNDGGATIMPADAEAVDSATGVRRRWSRFVNAAVSIAVSISRSRLVPESILPSAACRRTDIADEPDGKTIPMRTGSWFQIVSASLPFLAGERDIWFWTRSHLRLLFAIQTIMKLAEPGNL
jgi:hypothetical protein